MWVYLYIETISAESQLYVSKKIGKFRYLEIYRWMATKWNKYTHIKYYFVVTDLPHSKGLDKMYPRNVSTLHVETF